MLSELKPDIFTSMIQIDDYFTKTLLLNYQDTPNVVAPLGRYDNYLISHMNSNLPKITEDLWKANEKTRRILQYVKTEIIKDPTKFKSLTRVGNDLFFF